MANIKIRTAQNNGAPCPPPPLPAGKVPAAPRGEFPPRPLPPPAVLFPNSCCCPTTEQVVDNVTVVSLTPELIEVVEGTYMGMKAYGIDGSKITQNSHHEYTAEEIDVLCDDVDANG